ncbi:N-acetyltransferase [Verrucomicrobia bacterium]|nr:N-acetyltransferase [Verrucomicrobiota bacterium]
MKQFFSHPTAIVENEGIIGKNSKIWHFSHIFSEAKIGSNCNIGQNVMISNGVTVGSGTKIQNNVSLYSGIQCEEDVFLGPSCVFTNVKNPRSQINRKEAYEKTLIKRGATVGANATIVCGVTLGKYCFIGAGTVITKDVPDYALVVGNPGKQIGWFSRHGQRLLLGDNQEALCPESGLTYFLTAEGNLKCKDLGEEEKIQHTIVLKKQNKR